MTSVTLSRGQTSVDVPLLAEGGELLIARDVGKPNAKLKSIGLEDPFSRDHYSAQDRVVAFGLLNDDNAYADAKTLIEDLAKPHSDGTALELDPTAVSGYDNTLEVAPIDASAVEVEYLPGRTNMVVVGMSFPIVNTTVG